MGIFPYKTLEHITQNIKDLNLDLVSSENTAVLFQPIKIPNSKKFYRVPNRLAIHPMEGFDATDSGDPTSLTFERYKRFGNSGAGVVWCEAVAVVPEGRSNPHQLLLTESNSDSFKELVTKLNEGRTQLLNRNNDLPKELFQNPLKIIQLTHSGRYSKPGKIRHPLRATENSELDAAMHINPNSGEIVSDEYLDDLQENYLDAIALAEEAGFDGVDIKSCHGYLISELLGSYSRLKSRYGGESHNQRGKLLLNIVKKACQNYPNLLITVRINLFDALPYPHGLTTKTLDENGVPSSIELTDLHQLLNQLQSYGVRLVSFSAGNPYYKPFLSRPYVQNAFNGPEAPEHPLVSIERINSLQREISVKHPDLITIGTALSWLRQFSSYIAAGEIERNSFDIAGFGRMAFAHPKFPVDIFQNSKVDPKSACIACSKCTELMRMGSVTGCAIRNPIYTKIYREAYKNFIKKKTE